MRYQMMIICASNSMPDIDHSFAFSKGVPSMQGAAATGGHHSNVPGLQVRGGLLSRDRGLCVHH